LIDVPIIIRNYMKDGKLVNTGTLSNSWQMVRRFFIYDLISGYQDANSFSLKRQPPKYVRWASSIKFRITLDPT
jgi:Meckelin (Transmembrane protein 67)